MKTYGKVMLITLLFTLSFTAPVVSAARDYTDFIGKKIGVVIGSICDQLSERGLDATPVYYLRTTGAIRGIRSGEIDGFMLDLPAARTIVGHPGNEDLRYVGLPPELFSAQIGAISANQDMINRFNIFLAKLTADGTLAVMRSRWLESDAAANSRIPDISLTGINGTLKVATDGDSMPFAYSGVANGGLKNYSIELVLRFAAHEGMDVEFTDVNTGGMIPYTAGGRADLSLDAFAITEERKKNILFTDPIYEDRIAIVTLRYDGVETKEGGGFIHWLKTGIEQDLIAESRWKMVLNGFGVTIVISFASQILGTALGCFVCFLLMRGNKPVRQVTKLYCGFVRGVPAVVMLILSYYVILGSVNISPVPAAILTLAAMEGANIGMTLKSSIKAVDPVEIEAARSIGFSEREAFAAIILPQAVRNALSSYANGFVSLVRTTAVVGCIAVQDLTMAGSIIRNRTFDGYFPIIIIALLYFAMAMVCVSLFNLAVRTFDRGGGVR